MGSSGERTVGTPGHDEQSYFRYLPVGRTDELWQLYVTTVGRITIGPGESYPYEADRHPPGYTLNWSAGRVLNEFQFVYVTRGAGRFRSFHGEITVSPGTVLLLIPGERHWYRPDSDTGWSEYWVGFRGECADAWLDRGFITRDENVYYPGIGDSLLSLFDECIHLAGTEPPCMQQLISSRVHQIMARLYAGRRRAEGTPEKGTLFEQARIIFEDHIYRKFDIEEITSLLSVSYYTLRECFNRHTGMSPYHYFLQMKINRSKELLLRGELSVKEVSFRLAFDSPYYFSRLFKKKTGVSPSKWNGADLRSGLELWDPASEP